MVGVVVGGNHSTVAVGEDVDVAVGVNSTLGCGVWVGAQAENIIISINPLKVKLWIRLWILWIILLNRIISLYDIKLNSGDNAQNSKF